MAFTIDASSDNLQLADNAALTLPDGDWTIVLWVKQTTDIQAYGQRTISTNDGGSTKKIDCSISSTGNLDFFFTDDDGTTVSGAATGALMDNNTNWVHVTYRRSGTTVELFQDAVSKASVTDATFNGLDFAAPLYIGNRGGGTQNRGLIGSMAEFAKWDRALNADELVALSKGFSPAFFRDSLKLYFPMIREYVERIVNVAVTNTSTVVGVHPRIIYPDGFFTFRGISAGGAQDITLSGLASTSAYGTQSVLLNLDTTGIASTSGFGTQSILLNLNTSGIASTGAVGTQSILLNIDASGIASISAIGTQVLANTQILELSGIASTSTLGTQSILLNLDLTGIPSTTALGTSGLELSLTLAGIASTTALGTSGLELNLSLSGISSTAAFGTGVLSYEQTVSLSGISSTNLFGLVEVGFIQQITLSGLPSTTTLGTAAVFSRIFTIVSPTTGSFTQVTD